MQINKVKMSFCCPEEQEDVENALELPILQRSVEQLWTEFDVSGQDITFLGELFTNIGGLL